jgi:formylglycine-generating enzyme
MNSTQANFDGTKPYEGAAEGPDLERTEVVGSYPPNAFGLYDMHGNVSEWCADWYGRYPKGRVTDPQGPETGEHCIVRGGGWVNAAQRCRAAVRAGLASDYRHFDIGFRVCFSPQD